MLRSLVLSALALSLTISLNADETKPPKPAKPKPAATKLLIPAKEGRDLLAKGVLFLDVRSKSVYLKGHIPGAQHVDVAQWTRQLKNETTRTDAKLWAKQIGQLGISKDTWVVVYGTDSAINPARAWWSLKYLGLEKVSILHEGWGMWAAWGGKIATTTRKLKTTQFVPKFQKERLALTQDVKAYHRDKKFQVLDSRSLGEYEGGRIPNSNRFEWKGCLRVDGKYMTPKVLRKQFEKAGFDKARTIVPYRQSGGRSSVVAFALELGGYPNVSNYIGSWAEWSRAEDAPVEK